MTRRQNPAVNRKIGQKIALTAGFLLAALCAQAETWRFALIGDTPYVRSEREALPAMLDAIADSGVALVAHIGDIKSGSSRCSDALFHDRLRLFNAARLPFVYVPGDNEWSDCDRTSAGRYDPLERLQQLRRLFWTEDRSLGRVRLPLHRQSAEFPEHARLRLGPVLLLTLNVPGGNNNRGLAAEASAEFAERNPAVLRWLREGFQQARREKLAGIVVLMQANPDFLHFNAGAPPDGYRELLDVLRTETRDFPGQVLVAHGDTHFHRVDQPMRRSDGHVEDKLTRVESYGYPFMGWAEIIIDPQATTLFRVVSHPWPPARESSH